MGTNRSSHDVLQLPRLLDMRQVAEHICTTARHIRRLVAERRIPFVRVGRFVRFDPAAVAAWIDQQSQA